MSDIQVRSLGGDAFAIRIRGHLVVADQPLESGGQDAGPTPTELFVASLAACAAFYAGRFLRRHKISTDDLEVRSEFRMSLGDLARVEEVTLWVDLPPGFPHERRSALRRVIERCTVHNSIREAPQVRVELSTGDRVPT
jgi:uncharacterized OsmC-like protein